MVLIIFVLSYFRKIPRPDSRLCHKCRMVYDNLRRRAPESLHIEEHDFSDSEVSELVSTEAGHDNLPLPGPSDDLQREMNRLSTDLDNIELENSFESYPQPEIPEEMMQHENRNATAANEFRDRVKGAEESADESGDNDGSYDHGGRGENGDGSEESETNQHEERGLLRDLGYFILGCSD